MKKMENPKSWFLRTGTTLFSFVQSGGKQTPEPDKEKSKNEQVEYFNRVEINELLLHKAFLITAIGLFSLLVLDINQVHASNKPVQSDTVKSYPDISGVWIAEAKESWVHTFSRSEIIADTTKQEKKFWDKLLKNIFGSDGKPKMKKVQKKIEQPFTGYVDFELSLVSMGGKVEGTFLTNVFEDSAKTKKMVMREIALKGTYDNGIILLDYQDLLNHYAAVGSTTDYAFNLSGKAIQKDGYDYLQIKYVSKENKFFRGVRRSGASTVIFETKEELLDEPYNGGSASEIKVRRKSAYTDEKKTELMEKTGFFRQSDSIFNNIMFVRSDHKFLTEEDSLEAVRIAKLLSTFPNWSVQITGHTDNTGSWKKNMKLSQQRVEAIKTLPVQQGINSARIKTRFFGPFRPLTKNRTEQEKAINRRVRVRIIPYKLTSNL